MSKSSKAWVEVDGIKWAAPQPVNRLSDIRELRTDGKGRYFNGPFAGWNLNFSTMKKSKTTWTLDEWRIIDHQQMKRYNRLPEFKSRAAAEKWLASIGVK